MRRRQPTSQQQQRQGGEARNEAQQQQLEEEENGQRQEREDQQQRGRQHVSLVSSDSETSSPERSWHHVAGHVDLEESLYHTESVSRLRSRQASRASDIFAALPAWTQHSKDASMDSSSNHPMRTSTPERASAATSASDTKTQASTQPQAEAKSPTAKGEGAATSTNSPSWLACFLDQFWLERGEEDTEEMDRELEHTSAQIYSAFKLLVNFERLLLLGVWACFDILLELVCVVPVKALIALVQLVLYPVLKRCVSACVCGCLSVCMCACLSVCPLLCACQFVSACFAERCGSLLFTFFSAHPLPF